MQQSLISKADADSKYESNIDMLNQQFIKLRPDAIQLQVEDVEAEYSQEDCLFAAIIMQYKARCRALPGMEVHHACLESVKAFRQAIMRWVQTYEDIVSPFYPDAKNPKFVKSIGQHRWGGNLELAVAATILQCDIQIIPMIGDDLITVPPLTVTGPRGPLLILGWINNKHHTSTRPRSSRSALVGVGGSANVDTAQARAASSQRVGPGDAVGDESLTSDLQCMCGHESQQLEEESARDDAAPMDAQALDQGSGADAGRGPAEGPDGRGELPRRRRARPMARTGRPHLLQLMRTLLCSRRRREWAGGRHGAGSRGRQHESAGGYGGGCTGSGAGG